MNNKRMFQWVERGESLFPEVVLRDFASEGQIPEACLLYKGKPIMVMDQCYEIFPWWKVRGRARRVAKRLDAFTIHPMTPNVLCLPLKESQG